MTKWYNFSIEVSSFAFVLVAILYLVYFWFTGTKPIINLDLSAPITILAIGGGVGTVNGFVQKILRAMKKFI